MSYWAALICKCQVCLQNEAPINTPHFWAQNKSWNSHTVLTTQKLLCIETNLTKKILRWLIESSSQFQKLPNCNYLTEMEDAIWFTILEWMIIFQKCLAFSLIIILKWSKEDLYQKQLFSIKSVQKLLFVGLDFSAAPQYFILLKSEYLYIICLYPWLRLLRSR